jgi:hypothetical protein
LPTDSLTDSAAPAESVRLSRNPSRRSLVITGIALVAVVLVVGAYASSNASKSGRTKPSATAASEVKTGDPNVVAKPGTRLMRVTTPPAKTHAMISLPAGTPELAVRVKFEPYGISPSGAVVVRVSEAEPTSGGNESATLAKRLTSANLLARAGKGLNVAALYGGKYSGTLKVVPDQGAYALVLTDAEPLP